ncbi:GNAT family N-acetyltransferase [Persicirhabdus sediminis]|uniref:GNAT family N-acetyltransferase n=1 Tax=Persicirhabdus sediminis TaxID=454144 RepID=A0A8J7SHD3_9BACT|nr:GNAT family N-acetyltransferase [Persicirhabdus sediminis]MBK1789764.1 GNAT family N-acetyltransferase [Persicirhabdus sediminis]
MFYRKISDSLEIRLSVPQFAEELFKLTDRNRQFLKQWLPWLDYIESADDTRSFINTQLLRFAKGEALHISIFYKDKLVGVAGLNEIDKVNSIGYLGYWLGEEHNGLGIMSQVVTELIKVSADYYKLQRIDIRCATPNAKSRAIPERLGFTHEGTLRRAEKVYDQWFDHEVYSHLIN